MTDCLKAFGGGFIILICLVFLQITLHSKLPKCVLSPLNYLKNNLIDFGDKRFRGKKTEFDVLKIIYSVLVHCAKIVPFKKIL